MPNISLIRQDYQFFSLVHDFMLTYQQLAAIKMEEIRDTIVQTRRYIDGLSELFVDVRQSHEAELNRIITQGKNKKTGRITLSTIAKNDKEAIVLLSPDTKFSGDLTHRVFDAFSAYATARPTADIIIIGTIGEQLFKIHFGTQAYTSFHLPQALVSFVELREVSELLLQYSKIEVFFSRFLSLVKQQPVHSNVSGDVSVEDKSLAHQKQQGFLFEPELHVVLSFFEMQIFSSLVQQTVNESFLANLGSRITTLENATQEIKRKQSTLQRTYVHLQRQKSNRKQRDRMAGMLLW